MRTLHDLPTDDDPRITVVTEHPLAVWRDILIGLTLVGSSAFLLWGALALLSWGGR